MELFGKVSIQQLGEVTSLAGNNMFHVGKNNQPYFSKRITYDKLSAQVYKDVGGKVKEEIFRSTLDSVTAALADSVGAISAMELQHAAEISSLSAGLLSANYNIWLLQQSHNQMRADLDRLSAFVHGDLVDAVLKIANCQLSVKTDLSGIKNDLSVKVIW